MAVCSISRLLNGFLPSGAVQKQKPPDGGLLNEISQPHLWEQRKIPTGDVRGSDHGGNVVFSGILSTGNRGRVNFYGQNKIRGRHLSSKEQPHSLPTDRDQRQRDPLRSV